MPAAAPPAKKPTATSPTPAPAPAPAPAADAKPAKIEIPSMDKLLSPEVTPAPAPQPAPGEPTPAPGPTPSPADEDADSIPTDIKPGAKSGKQFAQERRENKDKKLEAEDAIRQLGESRTLLVQREDELTRLRADFARVEAERETFKTESERVKTEREEAERQYISGHQPTFRPADDRDLVTAHETMVQTIVNGMPGKIQKDGEDKRIFPAQILNDSKTMQQMENLLSNYVVAKRQGDSGKMDLALNAAAQLLGADVQIGTTIEDSTLLNSDDPSLLSIERAFDADRKSVV